MNGKRALFDSNIIIYLSRRQLDPSFCDKFDDLKISIITYMEILGYDFNDPIEEQFIKELLSVFQIIYVNREIADIVVQIRKSHKVKLPDAIIAATAINQQSILVTRNIKDFEKLHCNLLNPFAPEGE